MRTYSVAFLGYGNVAKALVQLFERKHAELQTRYGVEVRPTGVATRTLGWWANPEGVTLAAPQHWATSSPRPSPGATTCTCRNSAAQTGNGGVNVQPPADWRPATTCRTTGARHSPSTVAAMVNARYCLQRQGQ